MPTVMAPLAAMGPTRQTTAVAVCERTTHSAPPTVTPVTASNLVPVTVMTLLPAMAVGATAETAGALAAAAARAMLAEVAASPAVATTTEVKAPGAVMQTKEVPVCPKVEAHTFVAPFLRVAPEGPNCAPVTVTRAPPASPTAAGLTVAVTGTVTDCVARPPLAKETATLRAPPATVGGRSQVTAEAVTVI